MFNAQQATNTSRCFVGNRCALWQPLPPQQLLLISGQPLLLLLLLLCLHSVPLHL